MGFAKSHRDFVKDFMPQQEAFYPVFDAIFSRFSPFFNFFPCTLIFHFFPSSHLLYVSNATTEHPGGEAGRGCQAPGAGPTQGPARSIKGQISLNITDISTYKVNNILSPPCPVHIRKSYICFQYIISQKWLGSQKIFPDPDQDTVQL